MKLLGVIPAGTTRNNLDVRSAEETAVKRPGSIYAAVHTSSRRPVVIGLWVSICCAVFGWAQNPPVAPVRPVVDDYFGTKVTDPYRYMENVKDAEVQAWMKAQADHAASVLGRIPGRQSLLERIRELDSATVARVHSVVRLPNGKVFYQKRGADDDVFKIYMRDSLDGAERLLVDPETFLKTTGKPHAVNYSTPSNDGKYLGYGVSPSGSEEATLYIMETATGRHIDQPIDRVQFGIISWLDDGSGFVYWRSQKLGPDDPPTLKYQNSKSLLHKLGADPEKDQIVFGIGVKGVELQPTEFPIVFIVPGCPHAIGLVTTGVSPEFSALYTAPVSELKGDQTPWKKIAAREDKISNFGLHGDDLYLLTFKDAPRFKVVKTSLTSPDYGKAETVVPAGEAVVRDLFAAKDALYVQLMDGGIGRVLRFPFGTEAKGEEIRLPFAGSVSLSGAHPQIEGVLLTLTSWTKAPRIYEYQPKVEALRDTKLQPLGKYDDPEDLVSKEVKVKSHDGVLVPLSIVHKKGIKLDGSNPTLLQGYGAYGISSDPYFNVRSLAWLERGGILAVAHVRGGGEYGEEWHMAGFKKTKPNTWKDFIACAEYLVQNKYSSPRHLAGTGGSAGGILIGRALTERPDLFAAAIPAVGCLDMLRAETTSNGVPNIPEFGTVKDQEEFKALYEMSTFLHVKEKEKYPGVLLTHGVNDPRVDVWHSAKTAARLQAATTSGKPVLLRLDYETGHGIGTTKRQAQEEYADVLSFILWQCGVKEFQPTAGSRR